MSESTIYDKSVVIRNETKEYANTRGRVADVIDDINSTKANKSDVDSAIQLVADEITATESGLINYIDSENNSQNISINSKLDKPSSTGDYYIAITVVSGITYYQYKTISLSDGQIARSYGSYIGASNIYESISGKIGIGKTNPTEQLDVNGRVKADGFVINETTGSILPGEIKKKNNKLLFALDDGIEREIAEAGTSTSDILAEFTITSNQEIYFSSFDYATGIGNCTVPHGLSVGNYNAALIVANGFNTSPFNATSFKNNIKTIPYEYLTVQNYVKVLNATQIQICQYGTSTAITVNQTSAANTGNLTSIGWHVELIGENTTPQFDLTINTKNIRRIKMVAEGLVFYNSSRGAGKKQIYIKYYDSSNQIITPVPSSTILFNFENSLIDGNIIYLFGLTSINNNYNNIWSIHELELTLNRNIGVYSSKWTAFARASGAYAPIRGTSGTAPSFAEVYVPDNNGIAGLKDFGSNASYSNGTKIKIFKA